MLGLYQKTLAQTGRIVSTVEARHLSAATPCAAWDVRSLLGHLIGATEMYGAGGLAPGAVFEPVHIGRDYRAAYDIAAEAALDTMSAPTAMEQIFRLPPGELPGSIVLGIALTEAALHGWDLATATGQPATIDPDVAEAVLGFLQQIMTPEFRTGPNAFFGPEIPTGPDASPSDRLVAFLGRHP